MYIQCIYITLQWFEFYTYFKYFPFFHKLKFVYRRFTFHFDLSHVIKLHFYEHDIVGLLRSSYTKIMKMFMNFLAKNV